MLVKLTPKGGRCSGPTRDAFEKSKIMHPNNSARLISCCSKKYNVWMIFCFVFFPAQVEWEETCSRWSRWGNGQRPQSCHELYFGNDLSGKIIHHRALQHSMENFYREFPQLRCTELQLKMRLAGLHLQLKRVAHEQKTRLAVSSRAQQGSVADKWVFKLGNKIGIVHYYGC